jgi:hypothetical protein
VKKLEDPTDKVSPNKIWPCENFKYETKTKKISKRPRIKDKK